MVTSLHWWQKSQDGTDQNAELDAYSLWVCSLQGGLLFNRSISVKYWAIFTVSDTNQACFCNKCIIYSRCVSCDLPLSVMIVFILKNHMLKIGICMVKCVTTSIESNVIIVWYHPSLAHARTLHEY